MTRRIYTDSYAELRVRIAETENRIAMTENRIAMLRAQRANINQTTDSQEKTESKTQHEKTDSQDKTDSEEQHENHQHEPETSPDEYYEPADTSQKKTQYGCIIDDSGLGCEYR